MSEGGTLTISKVWVLFARRELLLYLSFDPSESFESIFWRDGKSGLGSHLGGFCIPNTGSSVITSIWFTFCQCENCTTAEKKLSYHLGLILGWLLAYWVKCVKNVSTLQLNFYFNSPYMISLLNHSSSSCTGSAITDATLEISALDHTVIVLWQV